MPSDSESALTNPSHELRGSRLIRKEGREKGLTHSSNPMRISNLGASMSRRLPPGVDYQLPARHLDSTLRFSEAGKSMREANDKGSYVPL